MRSARAAAWMLLTILPAATFAAADIERSGGPYVPTPQAVVDAMLELAKVGPDDFVLDLGSGDGRIVLTAALRYRARGQGFDIDPDLVRQSNDEAQKRGLGERVSFVQQDVREARIEPATVVTLYLLPGMMQSLEAKFLRELNPGTRVVAHDFPFANWKPDREVTLDIAEKYGTPGPWKSTLFYWIVPARVGGVWAIDSPEPGLDAMSVTFEQHQQFLDGAATSVGPRMALSGGKVSGDRVAFRLALPGGAYAFSGIVDGDRMHGEAAGPGGTVAWTASKRASATPAVH